MEAFKAHQNYSKKKAKNTTLLTLLALRNNAMLIKNIQEREL